MPWPALVRAVAAILGVLLACATRAGARSDSPAPGDVVPELVATTLDGGTFSLAQEAARHKAVIFVFFSVTCPYSNRFADTVREMNGSYRERGVLFVGVNSNRTETPQQTLAYAQQHGHVFPSVKDSDHHVADALGARVNPEAFLLDGDRRLRYRGQVFSKIGQPYLQRALDAVLAGRAVPTPSAKAFGCSIER